MSDHEAIQILTDHNAWRRGGDGPPTDPVSLGIALERAIAAMTANAGVVAAELESELDWFLAFHALRNAVAETLEENCHLADGDQCTLKKLKDAYAKAKDAGTGLDSENAIGEARADSATLLKPPTQ
jgi:hypothetical protein